MGKWFNENMSHAEARTTLWRVCENLSNEERKPVMEE